MDMEQRAEFQRIYNALGDDISQNIYKHRLLYSLFYEREELWKLVSRYSPASEQLKKFSKICYYGAGGGADFLFGLIKSLNLW